MRSVSSEDLHAKARIRNAALVRFGQEGFAVGLLATELVEQMTASTVEYLQAGVDAGTIRPSRDPAARARYLVHVGLGTLLVAYRLQAADGGSADPAAAYTSVADFSIGPGLELFTQGLFTDSRFLDAFKSAATTPGSASTRSPATGQCDQPEPAGESR